MGWNFRRSKKILPGVRLNFGKKSWGISFGGKHSRISYNSKTGVTARTSIPGTGISYTEKLSGRKKTQSPNGTPPRNHHTGLWVLSVLFAIAGLANLSKSVIGGLLYILAAVATVPIPAVQDRLHALNVRGWVKVVTVIALIVAGTALFPTSAAETPSEAATEPGQQGNAIMLVAGEQGLYGEWFTMNDEAFYIYRVPAGVYRVTNAGKYPAQVNVYKGVVKNAETGFDEYSAVGDIAWMDVGGSGEITVPEGWFIEIHEPTKITLVRTGDAPKPEPVQESEPEPAPMEEAPEPEKAVQSPESIVEFLNTMYSELGMQNYTVSYDDGAFVINLWEPGLTGIATRMANGGEDIPEDLTVQYETWAQTATSLSDSAHKFVTEAGRDEDVKAFILNEWNRENVIFCAINGAVCYDLGRGITW